MFGKTMNALLFLATGFLVGIQACTNFQGDKIPSVLELPIFETTPEEIDAAAALAVEGMEVALADILSFVAVVNVTTTAAQEKQSISFDGSPLDILERSLSEAADVFYRFNAITMVFEQEDMINAGNLALLQVLNYYSNLLLNPDLYKVLTDFRDFDPIGMSLTGERRRLLDTYIAGMELAGVGGVSEEQRVQLEETKARISQLETELATNIASVSGIVNLTLEELEGLSEDQINQLDYDNVTGLYSVDTRVTGDILDILQYATDQNVRAKVVVAMGTRVRDVNADLIYELISLRQQVAELLGYSTWADLRLSDKMAANLATAHGFVTDLGDRLYPIYEKEMQQLVDLSKTLEATTTSTLDNFQQADSSYLQTAYKEQVSGINAEDAAEYFEEKATIRALFDIYEQLFGITITIQENLENKWTNDLQLAQIADSVDGSVIAAIYLDLHPRDLKFTHFAFASLYQGRVRLDGSYQAPVGMIVGNWPAPTGDRPSLWTFGEVDIMFHEFGREY
jgi:thimet oligopeptidase